jgi:hypothetical protein
MSEPTYVNIMGKNDRDVRSTCCDARVQVKLVTTTSAAGTQIVWQCNACCKIYVARERDSEV